MQQYTLLCLFYPLIVLCWAVFSLLSLLIKIQFFHILSSLTPSCTIPDCHSIFYPTLNCPLFLCHIISYHYIPSPAISYPIQFLFNCAPSLSSPLPFHPFLLTSLIFYPSPSTLLHTYCYLTPIHTYENRVRAGLLCRIDIGRTGKEHARCKTPLNSTHW